ncbi:MAG: type II secretion system F family protein [Verrucomicrobia bacterium]|nr:type II secretion system F family protein [Verrucomicrobiota bacterium]
MSTFAYTGLDSKGKPFHGRIKERSWTQALRRVKEMGLFPISVKEQSQRIIVERLKRTLNRADVTKRTPRWPSSPGRIASKVLTAFTRQLATLIEAGIPLVAALRSVEQQEENRRLKTILRQVTADIEGGSTLSEALGRHPKVFSRLYLNMIVAGETAGMLDNTLTRLADFMERAQRIRAKVISSLIYPAAVIFVAVSILTALTVWVIPRFKDVFADLTGSSHLPPLTQFILGCSEIVQSHAVHVLVLAAVIAVMFPWIHSTKAGRAAIDRAKLKLPILGRIIRKTVICRLARTLGAMLESGVPVLQALAITRETTGNAIFAQAVQRTHDSVKEGENLTLPLRGSGVFPSTVISMIDAGEQSGALPAMLLKVADTYEVEVDNAITAGLSLLEPVLIVFLAVVVGGIVIGLFLPIIDVIDRGFDSKLREE